MAGALIAGWLEKAQVSIIWNCTGTVMPLPWLYCPFNWGAGWRIVTVTGSYIQLGTS